MIKMLMVTGLCAGLAGMAGATALDDIANARAAVGRDLTKIAGWAAPEFARGFGFAAAQGSNLPVPGFSLLSSPRVELGLIAGAGVSSVDIAKFRALPTEVFALKDVDFPSTLYMPSGGIHARVGAVLGLDGGFHYLKIPKSLASVDLGGGTLKAELTQWGISVRKTFFGGAMPFVTAGLAYDSLEADVSYSLKNTFSNTETYSGIGYSATHKVTQTYAVSADVNAVSLHALAGKQLGPVLPTLGASLNLPGGESTVTLSAADAVTLTQVGNATNTASQAVSVSGTAKAKAETDVRAQAGLEISLFPFVRFGLLGEYGLSSKIAGASAGLRFQF